MKQSVAAAIFYGLLFLAGAAVFWTLRDHGVQSGDYLEYSEQLRYGWDQPIYHIREPGAVLAWQACAWSARWVTTGEWFKPARLSTAERETGFDLLGAISGGCFLALLAAFLREGSVGRAGRVAAAAAVLVSAITWTFVGHIEFYAPLYAGLMLYYWRAARYVRDPTTSHFAWMIVGAAVAVTMHRSAMFQLPAIALVWVSAERPYRPIRPTREQSLVLLLTVIALCLLHFIPILGATVFDGPFLVFEDYNWLPELITPLTQGWADYVAEHSKLGSTHLFTFGSRAHWEHFFFFVGVASPLGLPLAILYRKGIDDRLSALLLGSAICGWLWAFVWHPHLGYGDWDLFVNPGLPTNLLGAWLVMKGEQTGKSPSDPA